MVYFVLGNHYIKFFNDFNLNLLIPVYYTLKDDKILHFGAYSYLQYIFFNQYLRNNHLPDFVSLDNKTVYRIVNKNVLNNEKIFFKILESVFTKDKFFSHLIEIDNQYKIDYENYGIFYPDWELLSKVLRFSNNFCFVKGFNFDNFQTKIIVDIFEYFNKRVKVIDSWEYYFYVNKEKMRDNRAYLFFYFGYYNIELFIVSFGQLVNYSTNAKYSEFCSYRGLINKLYSFFMERGIFIKYKDLISIANYLLQSMNRIINKNGKEFNKNIEQEISERIILDAKDTFLFVKKVLYYSEFIEILYSFYWSLKMILEDLFLKLDLQILDDIYDGNFFIISHYEVKDLFLSLLNDIVVKSR